jgi:hypothetical protein
MATRGMRYGHGADLSSGHVTLWDDGKVEFRLGWRGGSVEIALTDKDRKALAELLAIEPKSIREERLNGGSKGE